jgi:hypothetical protein
VVQFRPWPPDFAGREATRKIGKGRSIPPLATKHVAHFGADFQRQVLVSVARFIYAEVLSGALIHGCKKRRKGVFFFLGVNRTPGFHPSKTVPRPIL